jgi:hypothetical protein
MSERSEIDELLSCYVDGEVSERQATEVKRMMLHDRKVAEKVAQMQRQRQLLAALPVDAAPADTAASVRAVLERRTLLGVTASGKQHITGSLHLLARKLVAAAAMLALLGGLAVLVYKVIIPGDFVRPGGFAFGPEKRQQTGPAVIEYSPVESAIALMELELRTSSPSGLNSVIARAIDSCGLWDSAIVDRQVAKTRYSITCGKEGLVRVMGELAGIWDRVDGKSLFITAPGDESVAVDGVTVGQVVAVLEASDVPSRVAWARQFAQTNAQKLFEVAINDVPQVDSTELTIPKPSLTSPDFDKAATANVEAQPGGDEVSLTITVIGAE